MAGANWRCAACDVFNGPAEKVCRACDTERSRPPGRKPSPAKPSGNWNCVQCRTNNGPEDLRCIGCDTGWKAATKKASGPKKATGPKKPAPRRPAAKKTAAAKTTAATKATAPSKTTTRKTTARPTTPEGTATARAPSRGDVPTEVFYPSASGGYTPATSVPTPSPPPSALAPPYTPPYRSPSYRPPKRSTAGKGLARGCLGLVAAFFLLPLAFKGCQSVLMPDSDGSGSGGTSSTAAPCPGRIAKAIPSGDGAELVRAFRTNNKQITLCRTSGGGLYYFGEFSDHREAGIAMPAKETSDGYEATNGPYSYRIDENTVTIYQNGSRIGRESLRPEPSPS